MQLKYSENRKAFVTGGANGFGLGTAKELVSIGAKVTIADINKENLDNAQKEINSDLVDTCVVDVSNKDSLTQAIDNAAKKMGGLDTLVNSAGVFEFTKFST